MSEPPPTDAVPPDIDPIDTAITEPLSATVDGQSVTNRSVKDLIDADRHRDRKKAKGPGFGIGLTRLRPGSAVGE